jgi:hypothetical protein
MRLPWLVGAVLFGGVVGLGCPPAPAKDYTPAEIATVGDLTEVMRVLSHYADPWFGRRSATDFTEADYAKMLSDAEYIEAAARAAGGPLATGRPTGFADFAKGLETKTGTWRDAAKAKDPAKVGAALEAMRLQCKGCHSAYR